MSEHLAGVQRKEVTTVDERGHRRGARTLEAYDAAIEELALLSDNVAQDSVRLGAIRSRLAAYNGKLALLQALGLTPQLMAEQRDVEHVARAILATFEEYGARSTWQSPS